MTFIKIKTNTCVDELNNKSIIDVYENDAYTLTIKEIHNNLYANLLSKNLMFTQRITITIEINQESREISNIDFNLNPRIAITDKNIKGFMKDLEYMQKLGEEVKEVIKTYK